MVITLCPLEFLLNFSFKCPAVEETSQRISLGLVLKVLLILHDSGAHANSRQQFRKGKRFRNVVIGPKIETAHSVAFLDPGGNQDHVDTFESGVTTDSLYKFKAMHFGHHYV